LSGTARLCYTDKNRVFQKKEINNVSSFSDYKVKDLSLAEWGRKEILLAQEEMPGLMALRDEYQGLTP
jgi:hypothetical protein